IKLDEVVMRALERDTDGRWPDAGEMLAAIQRYLYALPETPTPRDVASLVAKFCPPETRRLPTHLEALAHDVLEPVPVEPAPVEPPAPVIGPHTAVIPREGKPSGRPQRHKTFATHVEMKEMLERATPLFPIDAIVDDQPRREVPGRAPPSRALLL